MNCKVKRYDPINSDGTCGMCVEDADYGAYVEFADYAALAAELSALKAQQAGQELDELRRACAEILGQDPEAWPSHGNAPLAIASALALAVSTAPQPAPAQPAVHPDDAAVDRFAVAMKAKLAKSREKGRHGWQTASAAHLSGLLYRHMYKADPLDVANLAMMLHQNGQAIELPHEARHDQGEVLTEHSGCGRGIQVDQLTVRMYPGDKVVMVRGRIGKALAAAPAQPAAQEGESK
jgi:hypothetical protein